MHAHSGAVAPIVPVTETVEGWTLATFADLPEEKLIHDLDLGERLGFASPVDIRKLIRRLAGDGVLGAVRVVAMVAKTSGGRPGREFWLTESQALTVAAKSETPKANAILAEIIHVYQLARRGLLPGQGFDARALASALVTALAPVMARMDRLEVLAANDTGVVGATWAEDNILEPLRRLSNIAEGAPPKAKLCKVANCYRLRRMGDLAREFGHVRKGCRWANFPKGVLVHVLIARIDGMTATAIELGRGKADPRQGSLRAIR